MTNKNSKTVLITGATDGIGKALAIEFARQNYIVHLVGRNKDKCTEVLEFIKRITPNLEHKLYLCDLSSIEANINFLNKYLEENAKLDVLILNANIFAKKIMLSADGINQSFAVGVLSRYLFSERLDKLLSKSSNPMVIHLGGSLKGKINYDHLKKNNLNGLKSNWLSFLGSGYLVQFGNKVNLTTVPHYYWNPGIVNTRLVKNQNFIIKKIINLLGVIEPEEAAKTIALFAECSKKNKEDKFLKKGNSFKPNRSILNAEPEFFKLKKFAEKLIFSEKENN